MTKPIDPETLHDGDWDGRKASDSFFEAAPRYADIAAAIVKVRPGRLLDIGCGSGYLAKLIKSQISRLVVDGVDISGPALVRARAHCDTVWQVDLNRAGLPIPPESYDTVACVEVLEHLYDPAHCLREIDRVLVRGGRAVVTVPNLAYWRYRLCLIAGRVPPPATDPRHLHQFDRGLLVEVLASAGLKCLEVTGHRVRFDWLARRRPDIFSDILIATAMKS